MLSSTCSKSIQQKIDQAYFLSLRRTFRRQYILHPFDSCNAIPTPIIHIIEVHAQKQAKHSFMIDMLCLNKPAATQCKKETTHPSWSRDSKMRNRLWPSTCIYWQAVTILIILFVNIEYTKKEALIVCNESPKKETECCFSE